MPETIALISCVKSKRREPSPARDLYTSALFRLSRAYAERHADRWFILSAKYSLVAPDQIIEPYEHTLTGARKGERESWAKGVFEKMNAAGLLRPGVKFLWLAGRAYSQSLSQLLAAFVQSDPMAGMPIGKRLAWLRVAENSAGLR